MSLGTDVDGSRILAVDCHAREHHDQWSAFFHGALVLNQNFTAILKFENFARTIFKFLEQVLNKHPVNFANPSGDESFVKIWDQAYNKGSIERSSL